MKGLFQKLHRRDAFTIVELIVVISVIGVLSAIIIVSYNGWQTSTRTAQVKTDLNAAAAAMESAVNFTNGVSSGYPSSIPGSFVGNSDVTVTPVPMDASSYCLNGESDLDSNIKFYIYSKTKENGPQPNTCADRPDLTAPAAPGVGSVAIIASTGTTATVSWPSVADATSYIVQCASDPAFIYNPQQVTVAATSGTMNGTVENLTPSTTFYCRVKSINNKGTSQWSSLVNGSTTSTYGALPVAVSIEGYWTTAPQGFLLEDGSAVSRTTFADLFAVIGTTYGAGDGSTTFNLPDSRGRVTVNRYSSDSEFATVGQKHGAKTETLSLAQLPAHTHKIAYLTTDVSDWLGGSGNPYGVASSYGVRTSQYGSLETVGGGQSHNEIQPSIVKSYAIKYSAPSGGSSSQPATSIEGYWTTAPANYLLEDGSAVSRSTYSDLFAVIGTTYGAGDGSTTFNLPDSRGRAAVNISTTDTEFDVMGEKPGSKTEAVTIAQMPAHSHKLAYLTTDVADWLGGSGNPYGISTSYASRSGTYDSLETVGGGAAHNNIQPSIVKTAVIKYTAATSSDENIAKGTSIKGYWTTTPSGYLPEDGSAVSRSTYSDLFALIGTTYGVGDGSTTFNLPDSRGRIPVNRNPTDTEFDTMGEKTGTKTETLTIAQIPAHTHSLGYSTSDVPDWIGGSGNPYGISTDYNVRSGTYDSIETVGGGAAHNNIQPSIVKRFAIKY